MLSTAENSPPFLHFHAGESSTVYVPRGMQYVYCESNVLDSAVQSRQMFGDNKFCEPGPVAIDSEDGLLSHFVLSCPPSECLVTGCSGHELHVKGLSGCGIDTVNAPVGTSFNLTFVVFDSHRPAATASISRTILVISPCSSTEIYCPHRAVICAAIPCFLRAEVEEPVEAFVPPELVLNTSTLPDGLYEVVDARPGSVMGLHVWTLCGYMSPLDFTNICGAANQRDVLQNMLPDCGTNQRDECSLTVLRGETSAPRPSASVIREHGSVCTSAGQDCGAVCSFRALAAGTCPPSQQPYAMQTFYSTASASDSLSMGNALTVQMSVVPVLATASVLVNVTVFSSGTVNSSQPLLQSIAQQARGSVHCSPLAADVHAMLWNHVSSHSRCLSLGRPSQQASVSESIADSRIVIITEVVNARVLPSASSSDAASEGGLSAVGMLELEASVAIGADAPTEGSSQLQDSALSCLNSASYITLQSAQDSFTWLSGAVEEGTGLGDVRITASTSLIVGSRGTCSQISDTDLANDALVAFSEDVYMQQLLPGNVVHCPHHLFRANYL